MGFTHSDESFTFSSNYFFTLHSNGVELFVTVLNIIGLLLIIFTPISFAIFYENYSFALVYFLGWSFVLYQQRDLFKSKEKRQQEAEEAIDSLKQFATEKQVDDVYQICANRDRTQSFDNWVNLTIQSMAIDEIEKGNLDQELANELKQEWGDSWEILYPAARVKQELSEEESYWTALRKFDEQVEKDLR